MPNCWRCMELFDVEPTDDRPFVYHKCKDGCMAAHKNPNLIKQKKTWAAYKQPVRKKPPTWLDFGRD